MRTVLILANGEWGTAARLGTWIADAEYIIAADGGWARARAHAVRVDEVIGDLDSLTPDDLAALRGHDSVILTTYPTDKDRTDLELAIERAIHLQPARIVIFGALGLRIDHSFANVQLLSLALDAGILPIMTSDHETVRALRAGGPVAETAVDSSGACRRVSLLPLSDTAVVSAEGLRYPLEGTTMERSSSRGVSNCTMGDRAIIRVLAGDLLVVVGEDDGNG